MTAVFDVDTIGAGLPFARAVPELRRALHGRAVVVEAPPGTGKTTLVPPVVAAHVTGRVVLTQPRRVAAAAAARRLAALTGTRVGDVVGLTVRGRHDVGPATRIEVVTPGVLLRRLVADPALAGVDAVVLDEVHERGLDTDLLLGMLAEVRTLRDDLVLVAMSATLDARAFADLLDAEVVSADARLHRLDVEWAPHHGPFADDRGLTRAFDEHVVTTTTDAWRRHAAAGDRDALVFLPGANDVARVASALTSRLPGVDVLELHGRLPLDVQARATGGRRPGDPPRVVVTTALAESSLTVPGVRLVVDAGLSREPRRDAARGMTGLVTVRCSRDAADQRAGRAAREGDGVVVRCYDQATFASMPEHVTPEIASADLTSAALTLAAWGAPGGEGLPLPDAPPPTAMAQARATLAGLGAVDGEGRITPEGRALAAVPADPHAARALLTGAERVGAEVAAEVVAMLGEDLRPEGADLGRLLAALRRGSHPGSGRWRQEVARLTRYAPSATSRPREDGADGAAGFVVALAHPEWVARRRGDSYLLASGTRAALPPGSSLTGQEWVAVAEASRAQGRATAGSGAMIRAAAALTEEQALDAAAYLLTEREECTFDGGRMQARRVRALGAIELTSTPTTPSPEALAEAWRGLLGVDGLAPLPWSPAATTLRRRLAFCHAHLGDPWPDVSDAALLDRLDDWFDVTATRLDQIDPGRALRTLLPWPEAAHLDDLVPERLPMADGSTARVDYPDDPRERPVVAVRVQACFGQTRTPRILGGRVSVLFHLLSPARRPLAVTDDLASFWAGPWAQVRAEMRGRYPRHAWPQDPSQG